MRDLNETADIPPKLSNDQLKPAQSNTSLSGLTLQKRGSISTVMTTSSVSEGVLLRVTIPSHSTQKVVKMSPEETIWQLKCNLIEKMGFGQICQPNGSTSPILELEEAVYNFGIFQLGSEGKEGKFLDEMRTIQDYRLQDQTSLEFRLKQKIKTNDKENTKKNQKRLMDLVKEGPLDELKSRLAKGMDPNFLSEEGLTPLVQAVLKNDRELITVLIESGAILDFRAKSPQTNLGSAWLCPLHVAVAENLMISLQTLLYFGANPNVRDSLGLTPLYHAVYQNNLDTLNLILLWGVVNSKENRLGLNLDVTDAQGKTPLHIAASNGQPAIVQTLLEYGADVHFLSTASNTPLHTASSRPQGGASVKDCARSMLLFGADKEKKNKNGQTPSQVALMSGNIELSDFIKKWQATEPTHQPFPFDVLVEESRVQWQTMKKNLILLGKSDSKEDLANRSSISSNFGTIGRSFASLHDAGKKSLTTRMKTHSQPANVQGIFSSPLNPTSPVGKLNESTNSLESVKRKDSSEQRMKKPPSFEQINTSLSKLKSVDSDSMKIPPQPQPLQQARSESQASQPRISRPPPPPPGAPPANLSSMPLSFPFLPMSLQLQQLHYPNLQAKELETWIQKAEEERKKLDLEIEKLKEALNEKPKNTE